MLWNDSHESWRQFLDRCYANWIRKSGISKEAAADTVVSIHNKAGAQAKTGLHFNPSSVTEANRLKANCATLERYMEKVELFDLLPYILGAMDDEQKLAFAAQYLRPAGLAVHLLDVEQHTEFTIEVAHDTSAAAYDALRAMTEAALRPTAENLEIAERETAKVHEKFKRTRAFITAARNACKGAKNALGKLVHRKQPIDSNVGMDRIHL
jgi:hypothetical protein